MMLKNYLKIAFRNMLKHRAYTAMNIFGLAIGLTCCVLITVYIQDELSYDRYHANAERIYRVVFIEDEGNAGIARVGAPWGPAMKAIYPEVEDFVRFRFAGTTLVRSGEKAFYETEGLYADPSIFAVFTHNFLWGDRETALASPDAIVVSRSFARKYFGEENPVGQRLNLDNDAEVVVSAVLSDVPENSHFRFDFLLPFSRHAAQRPDWMEQWYRNNYHLYLLLEKGADPAALEAKIPALLAEHFRPDQLAESRAVLQPLTAIHLHSHLFREFEANSDVKYIYIFAVLAALVLIVACVNFINLATARAAGRAKEVGMRKVAGASRRQLIRQLLGETVLLSFVAMALALAFAEIALPFFNTLSGKSLTIPLFEHPANLLFALLFSGAVGVLAGAYPAFALASQRPRLILAKQGRGGQRGSLLRKTLVIVQFVASIALMIATGIIYQQLTYMRSANPGFNKEQVLALNMPDASTRDRYEVLRNAFLQNPNIVGVTGASGDFGGGDWGVPFRLEGAPESENFDTRILTIDTNYVEVMQVRIVDGRDFSAEIASDADDAFLLNETAARLLGPESAVGKRILLGGDWRHGAIIGVVKNFHFRPLHEAIQPLVMFIDRGNFNNFYLRLKAANVQQTLAFIEERWQQLVPDFPISYTFVDETFDNFYRADAKFGELLSVFTILAIAVACIGLYGLASFAAERRTKEIGVRKVLGASVAGVTALLSKDFAKMVLVANLIAWPIAWFAMHNYLLNFAYRIDPIRTGWWVFALAGGLALLIALLTVSTQAIRAALANPVESLRYE
ncbi:MAG: ABC transporter permease [bacterium]